MQVTITIPDELAAKVIADGSSPESYVERLIAEKTESTKSGIIRPRKLSREEFNAALDRLAQFSDKIPDLPIEAFSRASFYEDRD